MSLQIILFEVLAFLFAISIHESAHGWTAWQLGDSTAYDRGRVSLNPLRHISPVGTLLLPALTILAGLPAIGWAKPTPIDPRRFSHPTRDDMLTAVAGPLSNFLSAALALAGLFAIAHVSPAGHAVIRLLAAGSVAHAGFLTPLALALYSLAQISLVLGIFNLIPIPPLDGSHILRHLVPAQSQRVFQRVGMIVLILVMLFGGRILGHLIDPVLSAFNRLLIRF